MSPLPQPTQNVSPSRLPHHQYADPGANSLSSPHLRINCADPEEDSCPGRITPLVLASSRTRLSKLACHCTGTASVAFPQTNATVTRVRTMGQSYTLIRPGPGANPPIYPPFLAPVRRGLPEGRIPKVSHSVPNFNTPVKDLVYKDLLVRTFTQTSHESRQGYQNLCQVTVLYIPIIDLIIFFFYLREHFQHFL